jgi:hypothetical protein
MTMDELDSGRRYRGAEARERSKRPDIGLAIMAASAVFTISTGILLWKRMGPGRRQGSPRRAHRDVDR